MLDSTSHEPRREPEHPSKLVDSLGRHISYLRISVTDRCDLRCFYCMSEHMEFLPKRDLLTLEELDRLATAFVARGVRRIRITGGEPLVRRNVMTFFRSLSRHLDAEALDELTVTTNASQLSRFADDLAACGVRRINVSLDTLDEKTYRSVTRGGDLSRVLAGIEAARAAGMTIKINTVALRGVNERELVSIISWAHGRDMDVTLIETMPLGDVGSDRTNYYLPLTVVRQRLERQYTLTPVAARSGGPARYFRVEETQGKLGFITPLTHNFCDACNRVRLTCTGTLFMCLGHESSVDLRAPLRASEDDNLLHTAIDRAIAHKPARHYFAIRDGRPSLARHMNTTGG